jgi:ribosomal-protein-serine acetyltransferase
MSFPRKIPHDLLDDLCLNYFNLAHAKALFALVDSNRAYLQAWLPWVDACQNESTSITFIERALLGYREKTCLPLGIFLQRRLIGAIELHTVDPIERSSSIGYWLSQEYQGKGIMQAACKLLMQYGFSDFGLERISIRCSVLNVRSQSIPTRLGFSDPMRIKRNKSTDKIQDDLVFTMPKERWLELTRVTSTCHLNSVDHLITFLYS